MNNLAYADDDSLMIKTELIDGQVVMMSPRPRLLHVEVSGNIYYEFRNALKGKSCKAFGEADVYLDEKNKFIPDVMIVCNKDIIKNNGIHGAPDLVAEVLSPSTAKRDKTVKKDMYEKAGVKEYWLVNVMDMSVEVYINKDGRFILYNIYHYYDETERAENDALPDGDINKIVIYDSIKTHVCGGLIISLKNIFEGD